jgi:hypothetical protein
MVAKITITSCGSTKLDAPNVKWNVHDVISNDDTFEDLDILVANQL